MALKWYEWIGFLIIIIGFSLIGNNAIIIPFGLIIVGIGCFMILIGWNTGRKAKQKNSILKKIFYITITALFTIIVLTLIMQLILMFVPVK